MTKHKPTRSPITTREAMPIATRKKGGGVELICPFCQPRHALIPGKASACGTEIKVTAMQRMITPRIARQNNVVCIKCGKAAGGPLVQCMNGFMHSHDCAPGIVILSEPPKYDKAAEYVFKLPDKIRKMIEKRTGEAKMIEEVDPSGKNTGNVLGYIFHKK